MAEDEMSVPAQSSAPVLIHLSADVAGEPDGPDSSTADERRRSGRRARALDRLMDRGVRPYPPNVALTRIDNVENLLLFVDDDLRETALALTRIEGYLTRTLNVLESRDLTREHVQALALDMRVLEHLDLLNETIESLRRRMAKLASQMK